MAPSRSTTSHPTINVGFSSVGQLAGRGCSSKEKLYREHCEVHEMDGLIEKFCYCSFNLCNTATRTNQPSVSLAIIDSHTLSQCHSVTVSQHESVTASQCHTLSQCHIVTVSQCVSVTTCKYWIINNATVGQPTSPALQWSLVSLTSQCIK